MNGPAGKGRANQHGANTGTVQRPVARRHKNPGAGRSQHAGRRDALTYFSFVGKLVLAVGAGLALFIGYRSASSTAFFQVRSIEVNGVNRSSKEEIKALVRRAAADGVWHADLAAISAELKRQPWVRKAVVSRVLPTGLRISITEREPLLVARSSNGRFMWVDEDGVMLGAATASDKMPPFFIRGLDEAPTEAALTANRERLAKALAMTREWEAAGLAERVSEVNVEDLHDVRAQLSGDDAQIEIRLGKEDFTKRLSRAIKTLDEMPPTASRGAVTYLDAWTRDKSITIGVNRSAQALAESAGQDHVTGEAWPNGNARAASSEQLPEQNRARTKEKRGDQPRQSTHARQTTGRAPATTSGQATKERPRRVG